jgi:hypothetical protein
MRLDRAQKTRIDSPFLIDWRVTGQPDFEANFLTSVSPSPTIRPDHRFVANSCPKMMSQRDDKDEDIS